MTNNTASLLKDVFPTTTPPSKDRPLRLKMTHSRKWPTGHDPEIIRIQSEGCSSTGLELKRYPRKYRKPIELVWKTTEINENVIAALAVVEDNDNNKTASYEGKTSIVAPTNKAMTIVYGSEANSQAPAAFGSGSTLLYPQANIRMVKRSGNYKEYASETEIEQLLVGKDESRYYQSKEVPGPKGPRIEVRKKKRADTAVLAILEDTSASSFSDTTTITITILDPGIDPCLVLCLAADNMNRKSYSIQHGETQQQLMGLAAVCCSVM